MASLNTASNFDILATIIKTMGLVLTGAGILGLATGAYWAPPAFAWLSGSAFEELLLNLLPFAPVILVAFGIFLLTKRGN